MITWLQFVMDQGICKCSEFMGVRNPNGAQGPYDFKDS